MGITKAHTQKVTHSYTVHYPDHYPRENDPHYIDFEHYRKTHIKDAVCAYKDSASGDKCTDQLELHHKVIEFSLQNGVDFATLEKDFPGISNPDEVGKWIETDQNLIWYCLTPQSPVLMADGKYKAIEEVKVGDYVITKDGSPQLVTAHAIKPYRGYVFSFGKSFLTSSHRALTETGWSTALEIFEKFEMFSSQMVALSCVKHKIFGRIICSIPVFMMNTFSKFKRSFDKFFNNIPMLHNLFFSTISIDTKSNVSLFSNMPTAFFKSSSGQAVEVINPTSVGTKLTGDSTPVRSSYIRFLTKFANIRWSISFRSIDKPVRSFFDGYVHDISVAHNHSFVTSGYVVHNCSFHHRGAGGVHVASASDFESEKYVKDLIS